MINGKKKMIVLMLCAALAAGALAGCGTPQASIEPEDVPLYNQPTESSLVMPERSGTVTYGNSLVSMDASNTNKGYVMLKYTGKNSKIKVQIAKEKSSTTYTYNLNARDAYEVFPLSESSGSYSIKVFENVTGNQYSEAFGKTISVSLQDEFIPFLYPNQYVNYNSGSAVVKKGIELTSGKTDSLEKLQTIYNYVVDNFTYDTAKANSVQSGYLPNVDAVLAAKKGICFDYAAVMVAMLRSQNIPTKLVVGYTGEVYHAWVNVYLKDQGGWVDAAIFFNGKKWELLDPTFASSGARSQKIMDYINNPSNYKAKYCY